MRRLVAWAALILVVFAVGVFLLLALALAEMRLFGTKHVVEFYGRIGIRGFLGEVYEWWLGFCARFRIPRWR